MASSRPGGRDTRELHHRDTRQSSSPDLHEEGLEAVWVTCAITTDGLRSYRAAKNELGNAEEQEVGRRANNRVENSHLPVRRRERAMLRFRKMRSLQMLASVYANVHNHFALKGHLVDRTTNKERRSAALAEWQMLAA